MAKLKKVHGERPRPDYMFHCSGCKFEHGLWLDPNHSDGNSWNWNGDVHKPTISPSILVSWNEGPEQKKQVCHSFIKEGRIQYLGDCTHHLSGQTIDLPDYE